MFGTALDEVLKTSMQYTDITVPGFRSTFRDWASESTGFSNELCEPALARTVRGQVEAACRRAELFEKRRKLIEAWRAYCKRPGRERPGRAAAHLSLKCPPKAEAADTLGELGCREPTMWRAR